MAYRCLNNNIYECDGCGECEQENIDYNEKDFDDSDYENEDLPKYYDGN